MSSPLLIIWGFTKIKNNLCNIPGKINIAGLHNGQHIYCGGDPNTLPPLQIALQADWSEEFTQHYRDIQ